MEAAGLETELGKLCGSQDQGNAEGTANQQQEFKAEIWQQPCGPVQQQVWESQDAWSFVFFFFFILGCAGSPLLCRLSLAVVSRATL